MRCFPPPGGFARHALPATCLLLLLAADCPPLQGQLFRPCRRGRIRNRAADVSGHAVRVPPARGLGAEKAISRSAGTSDAANSTAGPERWQALFDGRTLNGWQSAEFGGEGEVRVERETIVLEFGESLTGITYQDAFPKMNYEIRLKAMRQDGIDFFCGLTFPYADSSCSLIVGGWAGAVVGLSNIDHRDASENDTTRFMRFEDDRWYRIRVRVTPRRIQAWIDDQQVVDQDTRGRRISIRPEVDLSRPLGIAAWQTRAALKDIEYRELPAAGD